VTAMPRAYRHSRREGSHDRVIGLPLHICELSDRRLNAFKSFLAQAGAEIAHSPNVYEVLRFRAGQGWVSIYRNSRGDLKFTGAIREPWQAFISNAPFRAGKRAGEIGNDRTEIIAALVARDGRTCFYCPRSLIEGSETIEHLVPATAGGPAHLSNLALAHRRCNEAAGTLSVVAKVRLREQNHANNEASFDPELGIALDLILAGLGEPIRHNSVMGGRG